MLRAVVSRHGSGASPPLVQLCRNFRTTLNARATVGSEGTTVAAGKATSSTVPAAAAGVAEAAPQAAPANPMGAMMFPWERAVLDGERKKEIGWAGKAYWVLFGGTFLLVVGNRANEYYKEKHFVEDPVLAARKKERLKASVMDAIDGTSFNASTGEDDPFDGLTPEEIAAIVEKEAGESGDPFEGMSPEEINTYLQKQNQKEALSRRGL
mmetsp:Transcript_8851/g.15210  ORF Transcript_8851/g.15210 Transcript_8851/m.15210 type:complete len:210 (-) Transcript_8851:1531-2160(-)